MITKSLLSSDKHAIDEKIRKKRILLHIHIVLPINRYMKKTTTNVSNWTTKGASTYILSDIREAKMGAAIDTSFFNEDIVPRISPLRSSGINCMVSARWRGNQREFPIDPTKYARKITQTVGAHDIKTAYTIMKKIPYWAVFTSSGFLFKVVSVVRIIARDTTASTTVTVKKVPCNFWRM